ncbi:MAG: cyclic nucleotide-binding domain-containing protein [Deinococcota bacterium]
MSLSILERVLFLQCAELFKHVPSDDLSPVAQIAEEVYFEAGELIIAEGELGDSLYLIVDGEVSIQIHSLGEVAKRVSRETLGELAIISREPRTADCVCLTDVTALRITYEDFWELLDIKQSLALGVIQVLSSRLDEALITLRDLNAKVDANVVQR